MALAVQEGAPSIIYRAVELDDVWVTLGSYFYFCMI